MDVVGVVCGLLLFLFLVLFFSIIGYLNNKRENDTKIITDSPTAETGDDNTQKNVVDKIDEDVIIFTAEDKRKLMYSILVIKQSYLSDKILYNFLTLVLVDAAKRELVLGVKIYLESHLATFSQEVLQIIGDDNPVLVSMKEVIHILNEYLP